MSLTVSQIRRRTFCALVRRATAFLLLALGAVTPAVAQSLPGDWIGLLNGGFKVGIHFEKAGSGFEGKLINIFCRMRGPAPPANITISKRPYRPPLSK